MKLFRNIALVVGLSVSSASWALTIGGGATYVGGVDDIVGKTTLTDSSLAGESTWVSGVLGYTVSLTETNKTDFVDGTQDNFWTQVDIDANNDQTDRFAYKLNVEDPAYYLLKFGDGGLTTGSSYSHFLFQNFDSLDYAVIDFSDIGFVKDNKKQTLVVDVFRISHISEFDSTSVPAPASLALLSLGLLGVVATRRKNKS